MVTSIKCKYRIKEQSIEDTFLEYERQYTSAVHIFYRYLCKATAYGVKLKEKSKYYFLNSPMLRKFNEMNHIELIQKCEWFRHCAFYDAYELISECGRHIVFGGKNDYKDYLKGLISKEDYLEQKLRPFYSIGTAKPYKGNQKFRLSEDLKTFIFQPNKKEHYEIELLDVPYNRLLMLKKAFDFQEEKSLAISYRLCRDKRIVFSFEIEKFCDNIYKLISNRVFAIDLNPNYMGWVVVDWYSSKDFRIISYGVVSYKEFNTKEDELKAKFGKASTGRFHYTEKKEYEVQNTAVDLIDIAKHFRCGIVASDGISIKSSNKGKGKNYNRLVNNKWLRNSFQETYKKNAQLYGAKVIDVYSAYTSVVGNFLFRSLDMPDMCLAAFEISRRAHQTVSLSLNTFYMQNDDIYTFPTGELLKRYYDKSCNEFNIEDRTLSIKEIYQKYLKKNGNSYRVNFEKTTKNMRKVYNRKNYLTLYIK